VPPRRVGRGRGCCRRGRGVGAGGVGALGCVRGKGPELSTSAAARDAALGAVKPPRLRGGNIGFLFPEGKEGKGKDSRGLGQRQRTIRRGRMDKGGVIHAHSPPNQHPNLTLPATHAARRQPAALAVSSHVPQPHAHSPPVANSIRHLPATHALSVGASPAQLSKIAAAPGPPVKTGAHIRRFRGLGRLVRGTGVPSRPPSPLSGLDRGACEPASSSPSSTGP